MNQRVLTHCVFAGLYPESEAASGLEDAQRRLVADFGVARGALMPASRLHVSLLGFAERLDAPPPEMIGEIARLLSSVPMGPFKITFNTVCTFRGRRRGRAVVLTGDDGVIGASMLGEELAAALGPVGFGGWRAKVPHLTLAWSDVVVPETSVDPVTWTACEFVLIDSVQGAARHDVLGRWPLRS